MANLMTRPDILEAAAQIIHEKGFHAASMQEIADAVNLRKASLYYHVSSKQEILLLILDKAIELLTEEIRAVVHRPLPPDERLCQAVTTYLGILIENRDLSSVLLFEHRSLTDEAKAEHYPRRDQFERLWRDLIQEGMDSGHFAPANPSIAAKNLLGALNWAITWFRPGGPLTSDQLGEQISQLLWACQGITDSRGLRAAPSAGALYPLEVYLVKEDGVYRYIPEGHKLEKRSDKNVKKELAGASWGQHFVEEASIGIVICAAYERVTSRYGERGIRYTDIEVGHAAENVHLEAVSLGLSSVPVGAFNDGAVSKILNLSDGEKPIYIIPVGYKEK